MPVGNTKNAQVVNASHPAGERINNTPISISGVDETRALVAWLRALCPRNLTAQLKAKKLGAVPPTADDFRASIRALQSLDGKIGVTFHIYSLPEDRCVLLLIQNLGKRKLEGGVVEEH
jgi:hypothetical protein